MQMLYKLTPRKEN